VTLDAKHEGGHYLKIKFDWLNVGPVTEDTPQVINKQEIDSGFMKEWTVLKIEGEEKVQEEVEVDPKAKAKAPPAKGAPKAATGALEEITDNRPRDVQFTKDFGEEGLSIKVTEKVAKYFETFLMRVAVFEINRETQAESLKERYELDLSPFLFTKKGSDKLEWKFDKLQTMQLHYLNITVSVDQPMLSEFMRKKLNPL